jgi:glycosyltransferase involved in cell wall biosynthesis
VRIAVVTPYYREPIAMLTQCHESVRRQGVAADHFMIADGHPLDAIDGWDVRHVRLHRSHDDNGNTPRGLGGLLARNEGYDFIAYLDADNWYHPDHLRALVALWEETGSPVCTAFRTFHDEAGADLGIYEPDEDGLRHIDTSCFLIHRSGFACLPVWLDMPRILSPVGDRVFLAGVEHRRLALSSTRARTVAFRSRYRVHYDTAKVPVPEGAKDGDELAPAIRYLNTSAGVSECVAALGFWPLTYMKLY